MTDNARRSFGEQLQDMQQEISRMGSLVEKMVCNSVRALTERDVALAREVIDLDDAVDELDLSIEMMCMRMLAMQQPVAGDLRLIGTAMKIITDLERMGDYSVDIAKMAINLSNLPPSRPPVDIPRMAGIVQKMLRESLQAFVSGDLEMVHRMVADDDAVDALYRHIYDNVVEHMETDPSAVRQALTLLMAARYLERIADHTTNIGERIIYMKTGVLQELNN